MPEIQTTPEGNACLNVGCGGVYFPEWTNCDLLPGRQVVGHDLREPLPWGSAVFDAVYSSHVLEHLPLKAGRVLLAEQFRVLKLGGVCRVVVPDLEGICRLYLQHLEIAYEVRDEDSMRRYRLAVAELLDQMVREETGGELRQLLHRGDVGGAQGRERFGDAYRGPKGEPVTLESSRADAKDSPMELEVDFGAKMARRWAKWKLKLTTGDGQDPRRSGEVHRWMYDRLSLTQQLEEVGFEDCAVKSFDESAIPDWGKYNLDVSRHGNFPRKPDSLYVEGCKPA